jgi:hypothetical protein
MPNKLEFALWVLIIVFLLGAVGWAVSHGNVQ